MDSVDCADDARIMGGADEVDSADSADSTTDVDGEVRSYGTDDKDGENGVGIVDGTESANSADGGSHANCVNDAHVEESAKGAKGVEDEMRAMGAMCAIGVEVVDAAGDVSSLVDKVSANSMVCFGGKDRTGYLNSTNVGPARTIGLETKRL